MGVPRDVVASGDEGLAGPPSSFFPLAPLLCKSVVPEGKTTREENQPAMKKIQHNDEEIQQKQQDGEPPVPNPSTDPASIIRSPPKADLVEAAIGAIVSHRNWRDCSDWNEALKVWSETVECIDQALRQEGHGEALDRAIHELDAENAEYEKKRDL